DQGAAGREPAPDGAKRVHGRAPVRVAEPDLDILRATLRQEERGAAHGMRLERPVSERRADRQMRRRDAPDRPHPFRRRPPQRAGAGILDVDDVRTGPGGIGRLGGVGHADQETHVGYYKRNRGTAWGGSMRNVYLVSSFILDQLRKPLVSPATTRYAPRAPGRARRPALMSEGAQHGDPRCSRSAQPVLDALVNTGRAPPGSPCTTAAAASVTRSTPAWWWSRARRPMP